MADAMTPELAIAAAAVTAIALRMLYLAMRERFGRKWAGPTGADKIRKWG